MIIRIPYELSPLKVAKETRDDASERHPRTRKPAAIRDDVAPKAEAATEKTAPIASSEGAVEIPERLPAFVDELIESAVVRDEPVPTGTQTAEIAEAPAAAENEPADLVGAWETLLDVDLAGGSTSAAAAANAAQPEPGQPETIELKDSDEALQQPVPQVARFLRHDVTIPAAALAKQAAAPEQSVATAAEAGDLDSMTSQQAHAFLKALIEIAELEAPAEEETEPAAQPVACKEIPASEIRKDGAPKAEQAAETFAGVLADNTSRLSDSELQAPAVNAPVTASILVPPPTDKKMPRPPALLRAWWWLKKNQRFTAAKQLRVVETVSLGEKRFAAIIQADGKRLLVGGAPSGVSVLAELSASGNLQMENPGSTAE